MDDMTLTLNGSGTISRWANNSLRIERGLGEGRSETTMVFSASDLTCILAAAEAMGIQVMLPNGAATIEKAQTALADSAKEVAKLRRQLRTVNAALDRARGTEL